jgi:hypothetical protein
VPNSKLILIPFFFGFVAACPFSERARASGGLNLRLLDGPIFRLDVFSVEN